MVQQKTYLATLVVLMIYFQDTFTNTKQQPLNALNIYQVNLYQIIL